jgi:soluble lytic murein transglycosylase
VSRAARAPSRRARSTPRRRPSPSRRRRQRSSVARRRLVLVVVVALAGLAAFAISRIDFEQAIREVTLPLRHDDIIRQQAADKDLDPALIAAVIYAESKFREDERSDAGARGLMQVTPQTALEIADKSEGTAFVVSDLFNPDINIRYGSYHLRALLDRYDGNEVAALAAYNAGSTPVDAWGGADLDLDQIQFPETHAYVQEVLQKRDEYQANYADDLGL